MNCDLFYGLQKVWHTLQLWNVLWSRVKRAKPNALGNSSGQADNLQNKRQSALFWKEVTDINGKILAAQNMTLKAFIPRGKTRCAHILLSSLPHNSINLTSLVRLSSSSPSQHASCEDQLRRKMLEKIIRVDHAGEMGASFIYQGMSIVKHFNKAENRLT